jgi:murein L,D-transpeptidase YcbB/YkuD
LQDDPEWSREKIIADIDKGQEIRIDLALPVNVHIVYLTAWVDEEDVLNFRNDVYGRDEKLDKALRKKAVTISASISN